MNSLINFHWTEVSLICYLSITEKQVRLERHSSKFVCLAVKKLPRTGVDFASLSYRGQFVENGRHKK